MNTKTTKYILPTPGGAYYLAQDNALNWKKEALIKIFLQTTSLELNQSNLALIFDTDDEEVIQSKVEECQKLQLIQVVDEAESIKENQFETNLNEIIHTFSKSSNVLLSDSQGFCIANHGFSDEITEEISVLSADIAIMHKRRALNINEKLGLKSQAWAIVDASGNSSLGFWPINIRDEVFVLAVEGVPFFNQHSLVLLVWNLYLRFGNH